MTMLGRMSPCDLIGLNRFPFFWAFELAIRVETLMGPVELKIKIRVNYPISTDIGLIIENPLMFQ